MAIKNKIKADMYGEDAKAPIDKEKIKPLAFAGIKNLIKQGYDVKTSFFVKADYFKNADGKGDGHFLALGDSPTLEKKFKKEKTAPDVAYGNIFVREVNGKNVAHFEYVNGQGKLKKPADWKALFKVFKKMLKMPCVFVLDGELIQDDEDKDENNEADNTSSKETSTIKADPKSDTSEEKVDIVAKLTEKAKTALGMVEEVKAIQKVYDRDKKEKLLRKTTKWLDNYAALEKEYQPKLAQHFAKIQEVHNFVEQRLELDDKIEEAMNTIHDWIDDYLDLEDDAEAATLSKKIIAAVQKTLPSIQKLNDTDLLEECNKTVQLLSK